jgi:hypothetical protein
VQRPIARGLEGGGRARPRLIAIASVSAAEPKRAKLEEEPKKGGSAGQMAPKPARAQRARARGPRRCLIRASSLADAAKGGASTQELMPIYYGGMLP